jgi:hypothetical protein
MRFPQTYVRRNDLASGIRGISGAAPQQVSGNALDSGFLGAHSPLGARVYAKATTSGLVLTAKWQVQDDDGVTWMDVVESNNPSPVALITGIGTAATIVKIVSAPICIAAGSRGARLIVVSSGASGAGGGVDECSVSYEYRVPTNYTGD